MPRRGFLAWATALLFVVTACTSSSKASSEGVERSPVVAAAAAADPATDAASTLAPASSTSTAPAPAPSASIAEAESSIRLPGPLQAQIDELAATVESIRELEFIEPPTVVAMSPADVVARRADSLHESFAGVDFAPEEALYRLFGVFDEPVDLETFYTDFYSASTLAFYDLDDHELVIPLTAQLLTPYEQWILVHELSHALLDQQFPDVTARYQLLGELDHFDAAGGLLGLIEGEAILVQSLFYETLDSEERAELQRQADARRNETFAAAPAFFRSVSRFPYTDGSLFALYLYQRGGMEAVDRAYRDPPTTTEQIYVPQGFVEGIEPVDVNLRVKVPYGFETTERGTWGARGWRTLFGQFLNGATAAAAAEGWGGDDYVLMWNPETRQIAFVSLLVGDSVHDASEFGGALEDFVEAAMDVDLRFEELRTTTFTGADYAEVHRIGDRTLFIAASDQVTGTTVRDGVFGFSPP